VRAVGLGLANQIDRKVMDRDRFEHRQVETRPMSAGTQADRAGLLRVRYFLY
jgi:hypothetical protein